jgi:hypothetical protein
VKTTLHLSGQEQSTTDENTCNRRRAFTTGNSPPPSRLRFSPARPCSRVSRIANSRADPGRQTTLHRTRRLSYADARMKDFLLTLLLVGSRTGAVTRRPLLGRIEGFPLRARIGVAVVPFPVPAASHATCGFPALRAPAPSGVLEPHPRCRNTPRPASVRETPNGEAPGCAPRHRTRRVVGLW